MRGGEKMEQGCKFEGDETSWSLWQATTREGKGSHVGCGATRRELQMQGDGSDEGEILRELQGLQEGGAANVKRKGWLADRKEG